MASTLTYNGRLPGVVCRAALPPSGEAPLRLDTAAFVGFAERGPLNTPVAVEDASQYHALFGGDIAIARDGGRPVYAHLPGAVRAFFDNGGRRCYVVRVAGSGARANRFRVPGLVAWDEAGGYRTVVAGAAWVGAWSDRMTLSTQLRVRPLPVLPGGVAAPVAGWQLVLELPASTDLQPGDLLGITFEGEERPWMLFPVREVQKLGGAAASTRGAPFAVAADPATVRIYRQRMTGWSDVVEVERLGEAGWEQVEGSDASPPPGWDLSEVKGEMALTLPGGADVVGGDLLRVTCAGGEVLLFPVEGLGLVQEEGSPPGSLLLSGAPDLRVTTTSPLWEEPALSPPPAEGGLLTGVRQVDLLRFDLTVGVGNEGQEHWTGLCFGRGADYWAGVLAAMPQDPADPVQTGECLGTAMATPAGCVEMSEGGLTVDSFAGRSLLMRAPDAAFAAGPPLFLPIGMALVPDPDLVAGPLSEGAAGGARPPGKDGLDEFDPAALFLDGRLRGLGARDLIVEAEHLLYLTRPPAYLAAMHSLLGIDEVGLVAVPDLAHRAWGPPQPLPVPPLPAPPPVPPPDWSRFHNCPVPPPPVTLAPEEVVAGFLAELGRGDEIAAREYLALELLSTLDPAVSLLPLLGLERPAVLFAVEPPACPPIATLETTVRATLVLVSGAQLAVLFGLTWDGLRWLIAGVDPQDAAEPISDSLRELVKLPVLEPPAAFRGEPARMDALLEVQEAMVNLAAGRQNLVAVLSLPEHFLCSDVLDWQQRALAEGSGFDPAGLSYAAVYYPWTQVREEATPELGLLRHEPPDGAVCGAIAGRELRRGPWVAPAGVPFLGVLGLVPAIALPDRSLLFDAHVNLLYRRPGQFTQMSAHTLSPDRLFVQLSVRRLLIYLRKLALRRGMEYVFEPNNERFRRRVQASLERALDGLAAGGALAAYQVVTGEGVNTPNDVDNGRFIIALKIAPTSPIEFITVALLRSGEGLLQAVEA